MRSQTDYIVTKEEVHGHANHWLASALKLEYEGRKCNASSERTVNLSITHNSFTDFDTEVDVC